MQHDLSIDSAGIIPLSKEKDGWKVFLIQYRGYEQFWGCPKGRIEPKETSIQAAQRELFEETGLTVKTFFKNEPLLEEFYWFKKDEKCLKRILFYIAEVEGKVELQKEEIVNGQWFTLLEAIEKMAHLEGKEVLRRVEFILKK